MMHVYPPLASLVKKDKVLRRIQKTMRPGTALDVHHRAEAIKRIRELDVKKSIIGTTKSKMSTKSLKDDQK